MFYNYFRSALRSVLKNKRFNLLNVMGLAVGISCAALIFLWVEDELTFDNQFPEKSQIYLAYNHQTYDGKTFSFSSTPGPLGPAIAKEIPGIASTIRFTFPQKQSFAFEDKSIFESGHYTDSSFFKTFNLVFIIGSAQTAFHEYNSVVISEDMAHVFFGKGNPIGKIFKVNNADNFVVTGVFRNLPENCSFKFDWLSPYQVYENKNSWLTNWGNNGIQTFVQLEKNTDPGKTNQLIKTFIKSKNEKAVSTSFIYPMNRWRLYSKFDDNGNEDPEGGRIKYVRLFTIIAWIILIIACINFMNLSTARSEQRAKEVGVRKVAGAGKGMLIIQFLIESSILAVIAMLMAVIITLLMLPFFNSIVEKHIGNLFSTVHILSLIIISLVCGLLAGSYPAFYLSSFKPAIVLKGSKGNSGSARAGIVRKGLVVLQFGVSVILLVSTFIIYRQIQYVKARNLGYDIENLVQLPATKDVSSHFNALKNELLATGIVRNLCISQSSVLQKGSNSGGFSWNGKDPSKDLLVTVEYVTPDYISTMDIKLIRGRDFYPNASIDSNNIIINETLAKTMNQKEIIGSTIFRDSTKYTVVGVTKDFLYNSMYNAPSPIILFCRPDIRGLLTIRIKSGDGIQASLTKIESIMKAEIPGYPFEYKFISDQFNNLFKTENLVGKLSGVFAFLAVLISCMGLFGLSAYTAERRSKEIGIRKILGASVTTVTLLLCKDFLKLVTVALVLAIPVSYFIMHNWLQGFAYRIQIPGTVFLITAAGVIFIALLTVIIQSIKAAFANPVTTLKMD